MKKKLLAGLSENRNTPEHPPCVIGLTGPIASGKNAAATLLEKRGFSIIDADVLAHQILEEEKIAVLEQFEKKAQTKGISLANKDNTINRANLGRIVFSNKEDLQILESIVYPPLTRKIQSFIESNTEQPVVINAAALHKTPELLAKCSFFLYIHAHPLIRFLRVRKRNKMPFLQIFQRFFAQNQLYTQYLKKNVDIYRVGNNKKIIDLEQELCTVLDSIK